MADFPETLEQACEQTDLVCYGYTDTGEFTHETSGDISPADFEKGEILVLWPRNTTPIKPGDAPAGEVMCFAVAEKKWQAKPDHRNEVWYGAVRPELVTRAGDPTAFDPPLSKDPPPLPAAPAPTRCTRLGLKRAFGDRWPAVRDFINSDEDRKEEWELATEVNVSDKLVQDAIAHFQMSSAEVQALIAAAVAAVALAAA